MEETQNKAAIFFENVTKQVDDLAYPCYSIVNIFLHSILQGKVIDDKKIIQSHYTDIVLEAIRLYMNSAVLPPAELRLVGNMTRNLSMLPLLTFLGKQGPLPVHVFQCSYRTTTPQPCSC